MMHSSSVKIRKRHIIRAGDMFHMNNKFNKKLPPKPCISCKAAAAAGRPVNPIHGLKFLESETDFAFEGILPPRRVVADGSGEDCTIFLLVAVEDTNGNLQYRPADGNDPLRV